MIIVHKFFETNLIIVYFVYPLIFFLMGFGILLKNRKYSRFFLARSLQYLAIFGILHGIADWGSIFIPIQESYMSKSFIFVLVSLKQIINAVSFYFLFYFGLDLLVQTKKWNKKVLLLPLFVLVTWLANFIFLEPVLVNENNQKWWFAISDIWARYLLAFPGGLISCYALFLQRKQFENFGVSEMTKTLFFAVFSVGFYTISGGLIVPYAPVLPALLFNSELFFNSTGIPIELFRGISGLFMAFFILSILKVFDIEFQNYFYLSEKNRALSKERNKIARDLHDGMIQSIYATGLHLERIRKFLFDHHGEKIAQADSELQIVIKKLNDVIREIRGYIKHLKIPANQQSTLKEQIESLLDELNIAQKTQFDLAYNYLGADPPLAKSVQIYYIIKEAISNIIRHSEATKAAILVQENKKEILFEITDNGKGISCLEDNSNNEESFFLKQGIKNMKYRAQVIGGKLLITSELGEGTKITLQVKKMGEAEE